MRGDGCLVIQGRGWVTLVAVNVSATAECGSHGRSKSRLQSSTQRALGLFVVLNIGERSGMNYKGMSRLHNISTYLPLRNARVTSNVRRVIELAGRGGEIMNLSGQRLGHGSHAPSGLSASVCHFLQVVWLDVTLARSMGGWRDVTSD